MFFLRQKHMQTHKTIRKAVLPAAGLGSRFLPATKIMPKEMLTLIDKPLIHYAIEEAREAGIEEFIIIICDGKEIIKDHFIEKPKLNEILTRRGKKQELDLIHSFEMDDHQIKFVYQDEPLGLGHAIWCAKDLINNEPFAVLSCDDFILAEKYGCLAQMIQAYKDVGGNLLAAENVLPHHVDRYGILDVEDQTQQLSKINSMVEKPKIEEAPSTLSIRGRYILQPEVFDYLNLRLTGANGEIQLTDAIASLIGKQPVSSFQFDGQLFDCGSKSGYVKATIALAMQRPDLQEETSHFLSDYL